MIGARGSHTSRRPRHNPDGYLRLGYGAFMNAADIVASELKSKGYEPLTKEDAIEYIRIHAINALPGEYLDIDVTQYIDDILHRMMVADPVFFGMVGFWIYQRARAIIRSAYDPIAALLDISTENIIKDKETGLMVSEFNRIKKLMVEWDPHRSNLQWWLYNNRALGSAFRWTVRRIHRESGMYTPSGKLREERGVITREEAGRYITTRLSLEEGEEIDTVPEAVVEEDVAAHIRRAWRSGEIPEAADEAETVSRLADGFIRGMIGYKGHLTKTEWEIAHAVANIIEELPDRAASSRRLLFDICGDVDGIVEAINSIVNKIVKYEYREPEKMVRRDRWFKKLFRGKRFDIRRHAPAVLDKILG